MTFSSTVLCGKEIEMLKDHADLHRHRTVRLLIDPAPAAAHIGEDVVDYTRSRRFQARCSSEGAYSCRNRRDR